MSEDFIVPTKTPPRRTTAKKPSLKELENRLSQVERDSLAMRSEMSTLKEDVAALRTTVKQVDERTIRGEKLMLEMQGEQRKTFKLLETVAANVAAKGV